MRRKVCIIALSTLALATVVLLLTLALSDHTHAGGSVKLRPPFYRADGTYRVTAYFDHENPNYTDDDHIWIYNGERRLANSQSDTPPRTGDPYPYDGHDGWDWSMIAGTNVLAAAAGNVVVADWGNWNGYGRTIVISHGNDYYTQYSHLDQLLVNLGESVIAGQHIAESGATPAGVPAHLHFGVRHGDYTSTFYSVDPFGWRGEGRDPLFDYNGKISTCLWRSSDEDSISCADTIVEDAARGSTIGGAWSESSGGNGYHMYYRNTTSQDNIYASWVSTSTLAGPHQIYVYVPSQHRTTLNATYWIWNGSDWQQAPPIRQPDYADAWVSLGTYTLPANFAYVWMWANTGEGTTREIAADGVKFRQYQNYLPLNMCDYGPCGPSYGQLIVNGTFSTGDDTGWTTSRPGIVQLHSGSNYGARLGHYNLSQDQMYQRVCPGPSASYATFSFSWKVVTNDTPYVPVDHLYVRLRDADGNLLQTMSILSNMSPRDQWYSESYDLRAYTGQEIRISFEASNDESYPTDFWIDNVLFIVVD